MQLIFKGICFFFQLNDFGRNSLDDLEVKEKELKEMMQKRQLQALQYDANLLLLHTNQVSIHLTFSDLYTLLDFGFFKLHVILASSGVNLTSW